MHFVKASFHTSSPWRTAGMIVALAAAVALVAISCGQSREATGSTPSSTASVSLTDPPSCRVPNGDFKNVFISIRSVQAHIDEDANNNSGGWVELAPQLADNPVQIDLLSDPQTGCILAQLSQNVPLPPGDYQQIRLILVPNNPAAGAPVPSPNNCGSEGFNCAVLSDDTVKQLNLNSQDITGLKIPPGQIVGGPISVEEGDNVDINIDFNTCASIVRQGNDELRLKPTLTAGQVSQTTTGISGVVVDSVTGQPITGEVLVALEQADNTGFHRILMQAAAGADGSFNFCPLPTGMFDVVAAAVDDTGTSYNATALLAVPAGTNVGQIPIIAEAGGPGTIDGLVTAANNGAGAEVDVAFGAFQPIQVNSSDRQLGIPLFGDSTDVVATEANGCPAGTFCADLMLIVPASNPSIGTFDAGGTVFSTPAAGDVLFLIEASASRGGTAACSPSSKTTDMDSADQPLKVTGGATTTAKQIDFTGCTE